MAITNDEAVNTLKAIVDQFSVEDIAARIVDGSSMELPLGDDEWIVLLRLANGEGVE